MSRPPSQRTATRAAAAQNAPAGRAAADGSTATYIVGDCPIQHDGVLYPCGHDITLTPAQAERLGRRVAAIAVAAPGEPTTLE